MTLGITSSFQYDHSTRGNNSRAGRQRTIERDRRKRRRDGCDWCNWPDCWPHRSRGQHQLWHDWPDWPRQRRRRHWPTRVPWVSRPDWLHRLHGHDRFQRQSRPSGTDRSRWRCRRHHGRHWPARPDGRRHWFRRSDRPDRPHWPDRHRRCHRLSRVARPNRPHWSDRHLHVRRRELDLRHLHPADNLSRSDRAGLATH